MNEAILIALARYLLEHGEKVDHGNFHVVKQIVIEGSMLEIQLCDTGFGRKIWQDKVHIGTYY